MTRPVPTVLTLWQARQVPKVTIGGKRIKLGRSDLEYMTIEHRQDFGRQLYESGLRTVTIRFLVWVRPEQIGGGTKKRARRLHRSKR